MVPMLKREFAVSVTSDVPLVLVHLLIVFHVQVDKSFTKEDAGLNVLLFLFN